jgi:hypothetical protein
VIGRLYLKEIFTPTNYVGQNVVKELLNYLVGAAAPLSKAYSVISFSHSQGKSIVISNNAAKPVSKGE